eukprot:TRINITY_DN1361_c0_g2_i1.p1 TRINITY_DN1361_c0_g2~~TRINITY_DN1361_c0_g2_i1.p1  ORF type:complete len:313 (+),score=71.58 TRINITY_DN1361_c0_g2_i1:26-964(+)
MAMACLLRSSLSGLRLALRPTLSDVHLIAYKPRVQWIPPFPILCATAAAAMFPVREVVCSEQDEEAKQRDQIRRLQMALEPLRPGEADMRTRWTKEEEGWFKLPPRAWPEVQPKAEEVDALRAKLETERCPSPGYEMSPSCAKLTFDLASALVFAAVDPPQGLDVYRSLGKSGNLEGMVASAVVLIEGLGVKQDYKEALQWLHKAADADSAQALYELASLLYTGGAGLAEDEPEALRLWRRAAAQQHRDAMFMVADCLLEGIGCEPDLAAAVPLLHAAAMKGHRGARQHLRQLLDGKWMGFDGAAGPARIVV